MVELEKRERLPVSVSAAVLIENSRGLLLAQQASKQKGYKWGPPAGGMLPHEDPTMAAIREVYEELGVKVKLIDLVGIYTADRGDKSTGLAFVFRGEITEGEITPKPGEIRAYRFFSPMDIDQLIKGFLDEVLYKPEYNIPALKDWTEGRSYPLESVRPLTGMNK